MNRKIEFAGEMILSVYALYITGMFLSILPDMLLILLIGK